jgi:hypothetical protein
MPCAPDISEEIDDCQELNRQVLTCPELSYCHAACIR